MEETKYKIGYDFGNGKDLSGISVIRKEQDGTVTLLINEVGKKADILYDVFKALIINARCEMSIDE